MNLQMSIVLDESKLSKLVHEKTDTRTGGADHLGQSCLADRRQDCFRLPLFPEICKEQHPRKAFFARIEELIDKVRFRPDVARQKMRYE